jgi:hypothetical protein
LVVVWSTKFGSVPYWTSYESAPGTGCHESTTGLSGWVSEAASAGPISAGAPTVFRLKGIVAQFSPPPVARTRQYSWVAVGSCTLGTYWRCTVVTLTSVDVNWSEVEIWKS